MANENLSPDIYGVNEYVNNIKKEFITGVNEDTLMLGIFGYTGQIFSDMFQNSIVMASEFSNESIATKAKFEKNIIAHALGLGITDINAVPAQMDVILTFAEDDIINWANAKTANGDELPWTFIFDKDNQIYFGDYEFHTDYDIVIKKVEVSTQGHDKRFAYTAQYKQDDFDTGNPVAKDVTNPYLTPPVKVNSNGVNVILVKTTIRQVEKNTQTTKILSDNDVSSKTITFTFEGQLAAFSLDVTEGTETYHMVPVYEGLNVDTGGQLYFWYTFLDSDTIRIKFDRNSRIPAVNADVQINLQTTQGSKGNFSYYNENYPEFTFESDKYDYSNIMCQVVPVDGNARYGTDKKTIEELKQIIPREALSRGSITNITDLNNFFNMTNNENSKLYFYKKRDNCLERLFHSFMIMKNDLNIVPTNTINLVISPKNFQVEEGSNKLVLKQGQCIILTPGQKEARLLKKGELLPEEDGSLYDGSFAYYLPYDYIVSKSPLYGSYFMTTIHTIKHLDFQYINEKCLYQYIATKVNIDRNCLEDHNTYSIKIEVLQNITPQSGDLPDSPIYTDDEGNVVGKVAAYMIIYNEDNKPLRWAKSEIVGIDGVDGNITFEFKLTTEDYIDNDNRIRIDTGLYDIGSDNESYAHLNSNMTTRIFIVSQQGTSYGLGEPDLSTLIPGLDDSWSLSNTYNIIGGLDFFYDYSSIISSIITVNEEEVDENGDIIMPDPVIPEEDSIETRVSRIESKMEWKTELDLEEEAKPVALFSEEDENNATDIFYHITGVPVVKYNYFKNEDIAKMFYDELISRKIYIDQCVAYLEDAFEMDFKFFNTYGPSKFFTWNNEADDVDRVNITLFFKLKLKPNYNSNIVEDIRKDIKNYVEDINNIQSLHIPNLISYITNSYKDSIEYFEFVSINGKDPSYQHIYAMDPPDGIMVPEFININTLPNELPDINIEPV